MAMGARNWRREALGAGEALLQHVTGWKVPGRK